jgi:hypothetical protein
MIIQKFKHQIFTSNFLLECDFPFKRDLLLEYPQDWIAIEFSQAQSLLDFLWLTKIDLKGNCYVFVGHLWVTCRLCYFSDWQPKVKELLNWRNTLERSQRIALWTINFLLTYEERKCFTKASIGSYELVDREWCYLFVGFGFRFICDELLDWKLKHHWINRALSILLWLKSWVHCVSTDVGLQMYTCLFLRCI